MKQNEIITLCIGVAVIAAFAWLGGPSILSILNSSSSSKNMDSQSKLPVVSGKNISTDPKLQIIEVKEGSGAAVEKGSHVYVNYTGMLENGTKFDSSYDRGVPIDFIVGAGRVIKGWDLGLLGMKIGEKRRLVISSDYAYGEAGIEGVIPGGATLVFDLELVSIK